MMLDQAISHIGKLNCIYVSHNEKFQRIKDIF